ncbi:MAG: methyltransferase RsmF C-terminal domain-like protein [Nanoarchaeota archaeon]
MPYLTPLNSKSVKTVSQKIEERWGTTFSREYVWYMHTKEKDIYLINSDIRAIPYETLNVNNMGLYVANLDNHDTVRLSIEGSQILGPDATRNIIELDERQVAKWMRGHDIEYCHEDGYVIVRSGHDYMGCGRIKDNILLNFVPKGRRIQSAL